MINNPYPASSATQPRGMALINGERAAGLVSFDVDNNSFFQADTFRLRLALSAQPANRRFDFWATQTSLQVELLIGLPPNADSFTKSDLTSQIVGYVDDIEVDPLADTITMAGRDLTSLLIDTKRAVTFSNTRSSDIATQIAAAVGLQSKVVPTAKFVGTMNQIVKQLINDRATYWDVLTKLAQLEHYSVFVKGSVLNFVPRQASTDSYVLRYQAPTAQAFPVANFAAMRFSRNLSVSRGVKVTVKSWSQKTGKVVSATATRAHVKNATTAKLGKSVLPPAEYIFFFPNLTADQAQQRANSLERDISQHEVNLTAEMPGNDLLTAETPVQVVGTSTVFDQVYYPASLARHYSRDEGYRMTLTARNFSPDMQPS